MNFKKTIIIVISTILLLILALLGIYFFVSYNLLKIKNSQVGNEKVNLGEIERPKITIEEAEAKNREKYPSTIIGIIKFLNKGSVVIATIKTSDGKEYTLSPDQPMAIYESFKVKNGDKVTIQGNFLSDNKIEWLTIISI